MGPIPVGPDFLRHPLASGAALQTQAPMLGFETHGAVLGGKAMIHNSLKLCSVAAVSRLMFLVSALAGNHECSWGVFCRKFMRGLGCLEKLC